MNVWRCVICGDSYIGGNCPSNCPFCGAHEQYMVKIEEWKDLNQGLVLSESSRANIVKALEIEYKNSDFYLKAAKVCEYLGDDEARSIFKALAKVEAEHASVHKKLLKTDVPKFECNEKAFETVVENFQESLRRETFASTFYEQASNQAPEERVKQVFTALVEVEKDHVSIDKQHLELA